MSYTFINVKNISVFHSFSSGSTNLQNRVDRLCKTENYVNREFTNEPPYIKLKVNIEDQTMDQYIVFRNDQEMNTFIKEFIDGNLGEFIKVGLYIP
ncbi:MAG: hypothetical protein ACPGSD_00070 [Flavobacteriales bacterium]